MSESLQQSTLDYDELIEQLIPICRTAANAILEVYHSEEGFDVDLKTDNSPVTRADLAANKIIQTSLQMLTPEVPIITEETELVNYNERKKWAMYWLVDPLDGTKEFIKCNDQFTINIALIEGHQTKLGIVYIPVSHTIYWGGVGYGAFKVVGQERQQIKCRSLKQQKETEGKIDVVASINHCNEQTNRIIEQLEDNVAHVTKRSIGSSLKFCLLAEGLADVYPRIAPTCEWDTAAAQAVLEAAGGIIYKIEGETLQPLQYNTKESMLNPSFIALSDRNYDWSFLTKK